MGLGSPGLGGPWNLHSHPEKPCGLHSGVLRPLSQGNEPSTSPHAHRRRPPSAPWGEGWGWTAWARRGAAWGVLPPAVFLSFWSDPSSPSCAALSPHSLVPGEPSRSAPPMWFVRFPLRHSHVLTALLSGWRKSSPHAPSSRGVYGEGPGRVGGLSTCPGPDSPALALRVPCHLLAARWLLRGRPPSPDPLPTTKRSASGCHCVPDPATAVPP